MQSRVSASQSYRSSVPIFVPAPSLAPGMSEFSPSYLWRSSKCSEVSWHLQLCLCHSGGTHRSTSICLSNPCHARTLGYLCSHVQPQPLCFGGTLEFSGSAYLLGGVGLACAWTSGKVSQGKTGNGNSSTRDPGSGVCICPCINPVKPGV